MYKYFLPLLAVLALCGCGGNKKLQQLETISQQMQLAFAPDSREKVYEVSFVPDKKHRTYIAKGVTTEAEAIAGVEAAARAQGLPLTDSIVLLPDVTALDGKTRGVTAFSVATLRYQPDYAAEQATQTLMGMPLQVLEKNDSWTRVVTLEGYVAWVPALSVVYMTDREFEAWQQVPKVIVTAYQTLFREEALPGAQVVADGIMGNVVELLEKTPLYYRVKLPNGTPAWLSRLDAEPFDQWVESRYPSEDSIIGTAFKFVGFPYQWAGTSVKAMDCSGFTKTVYFLNGIILLRDASQQARMGEPVDISQGWQNLRTGDLIFFGRKDTPERKGNVTHVGIYIGDGRFIHSASYVRVNSLDPISSVYYEGSPRLVKAVRILSHVDDGTGAVSVTAHPWYGLAQ